MTDSSATIALQRHYTLCLVGWCPSTPRCPDADAKCVEARRRALIYAFSDEDAASEGQANVKPRLELTFANMRSPIATSLDGWAWSALRNSVRTWQRGQQVIEAFEVPTETDPDSPSSATTVDHLVGPWRAELTSRFYNKQLACEEHARGCVHPARVASVALKMVTAQAELVVEGGPTVKASSSILARQRLVVAMTAPGDFTRVGDRLTEQQRTAASRLAACSRALLSAVARSIEGDQ
jgi:hypothetical protein